jgi:hypothetical protein
LLALVGDRGPFGIVLVVVPRRGGRIDDALPLVPQGFGQSRRFGSGLANALRDRAVCRFGMLWGIRCFGHSADENALPAVAISRAVEPPPGLCGRARYRRTARRAPEHPVSAEGETGEHRWVASAEVERHFARLVEERRGDGAEDLLSALVRVRDEQDALSEDRLISTWSSY